MMRVAVGLSGGVDSFMTALLLKKRGYEVVGVKLDLWKKEEAKELEGLCKELDISLVYFDGMMLFRQKVVNPFIEGYLAGNTPNPCAVCNNLIKWKLLLRAADDIGAEYIATGHYVRIDREGKYWYVYKGIDPNKDQSYFLWGLTQDVLSRAITPLGEYTKAEVKRMAEDHGYSSVARKKESMGVCFLEGTDYRDFIVKHSGKTGMQDEGDILDTAGNVIGRHSGLLNYTVGQKRGLPLRDGEPMYVACLDAEHNTIVADVKRNLRQMQLQVKNINLVCREELFANDVEIKIRGLGLNPEGYIRVEGNPDKLVTVHLQSPAWAVASGQPVAFYRGEKLIGGGIIR